MMKFPIWAAGALTLFAGWAVHAGEPVVWRSGPKQTALLELFTSEGCSSCPPAEKWLSGLTNNPALWQDVVPVEFHVDYWDNLGWTDRFASPDYTARQQRYAELWKHSTVYTPGFVLNGTEWRMGFGGGGFPKGDRSISGVLEVKPLTTNSLSVKYVIDAANPRTGSLEVTAAWLGSDTVSDIRRGENAGSRLHHPFVVLRTTTLPLQLHEGTATAVVQLPRIPRENSARLGIAVWVSREGNPIPEQATGGWWAP